MAAKKGAEMPARRDGRKAMLTYMKPELIKAVKDAAAANDQKAWQFIEKAVERALKPRKPSFFGMRACAPTVWVERDGPIFSRLDLRLN
jgi:hypothetical protein